MDIRITSIDVVTPSLPVVGGGRSQGLATVSVLIKSDAGDLSLRYAGEKFTALDELVLRVQDRLKDFARQMSERLESPLL